MRKFLYIALAVVSFGVFGQTPIIDYRFEGTLKDSQGNVDGVLVNGGTEGANRFGESLSALSLDGINQYMNMDNGGAPIVSTGKITFEGWFNTNDFSGTQAILNIPELVVRVNSDGIPGMFPQDGTASYQVLSSTAVNKEEWFHLAATYDGSVAKIYINGIETNSLQLGIKLSTFSGVTHLGADNAGNNTFPGLIDDVSFYDFALSASEVLAIYQEGTFVTTWQTTTDNEQITIPINESYIYNYTVDWGDGNVIPGYTGSVSHTYATAGTYTVSIYGDFPAINFSNPAANGSQNQIQTIEQWGDINWLDFTDAFNGCSNLSINATDAPDLTNVTSLFAMFANTNFSADLNGWDVSTITNMSELFSGSGFNGDISSWNVFNVTQMHSMFSNSSFNGDISGWAVDNVISMVSMFKGTPFNADISNWNVANVQDMESMFNNASSFDQPINAWTTSSLANMPFMFADATEFNRDISGWDVSQVGNMDGLLSGATSFNQDLGSWDISSVNIISNIFSSSNMSIINYESTLQGWSTLEGAEIAIPTGLSLGASGVSYCDGTARDELINTYLWTFSGDVLDCPDLIAQYLLNGSAIDNSDYGYDATIFEAELTTDRFGFESDAYFFDGINDKISVDATNQSPTNLTMSAWFTFPESGGEGTHQILEIDGAAVLAVSDQQFQAGLNLNGEFRFVQTEVPHSEWNLGTLTYDGTTFRAYLNGVQFAELDDAGPIVYANASSPINIGMSAFAGSYFNGSIDDVSIYGRALSDVEIADLYSDGGYESPRVKLSALYTALGGDNWTTNTNWNSEQSLATWHGVRLDNGVVSELYLNNNNLTGQLPTEIGNFQSLQTLWMHNNQISGEIPPEIGNLTNMLQLVLLNNELSGTIPAEFGNMSSLFQLYLNGNNLTGELPAELGNLKNLSLFTVSRNELSGAVPAELANLSGLTNSLFLSNNQFTSLPDLTGLPTGFTLNVLGNQIGFEDLIVNLPIADNGVYQYSPQTSDIADTLTVTNGQEVTLTTSIATSGTSYQWYFNDEIIEGANLQDHVFTYDASLEGTYFVQMTNENLPDGIINRAAYVVRDEVNTAPTFLSFADGSVEGVLKEGLPIGTLAGVLVTEDVDPVDSYTYTFVSGSGDGFNSSFTISNDSVFTAVELDPVTAPVLRFRVRSTDAGGEFVENSLAIQVAPIQVCNNDVFTASSGTFDDGSGFFDYENNFSCNWLIQLSSENQVRLSFTEFNTEENFDFVRVYDGSDATATLLAELSGANIPDPIISSSNSLFVTFSSDNIVTSSGWTAVYSQVTPVADYPFTEGSLEDFSGYGNNISVNTATVTSDRLGGKAYYFDGSSSYMQATSTLSGSNVPFTISTWVRWDGDNSDFREIVSWLNESSISNVYLGTTSGSSQLRFGDTWTATGVDLPANEWVHLAATFDGSFAHIYLNGELRATSLENQSYDFAEGDLFIGRQGTNEGEYFDGDIDEIKIYDIALSASEIGNLYAATSTSLIAYLPFNNNFSDESGNDNNGVDLGSGNVFSYDRLGVPTSAFDFDVTNAGVVEISSFANVDLGDEITVMGWIRPDTYPSNDIQLFNNSYLSGSGFEFRLVKEDLTDDSQRKLFAGVTGISYGSYAETTVSIDEWTHVAFRFSRGQGTTLYINGQNLFTHGFVEGTNDLPIPISSDGILIGEGFDGEMDEIKIFNSALTDQEILDEYEENLWPFASMAFRGPEGGGDNTDDKKIELSPDQTDRYLGALQLDFAGDYQFRPTASDGIFEAFLGDNELDGIAETQATQIPLTEGFYAIGFRQSNFKYFVEPITSVGIIGSALTGDDSGWLGNDVDLTNLGNNIYQIQNLDLFDGGFKLRINDDWAYIDWGSNNLDGTLDYRGNDIPIQSGKYTLTFDLLNNKYTILDVSASETVVELDFSGNLIDDSGYGNNGTTSSETYTVGRFGNDNTAIVLNGGNNIDIGNDASINLSNGFTMNIWINPSVNDNEGGIFTSGGSFHQHISPTFFNWRYYQSNEEKQINGIPIEAPINTWTMITWTYDGGTMRFYDDGVLVHTETVFGDIDVTSGSYLIGAGFNGAVDALLWIDGVLSDKEIQYLYTDNLILDYALDGNTDDQSGNNINGSLPNGGTYIDDRFGNFTVALSLNGSDQYIEVDNADQPLITGNAITFEGWFQTYDLSNEGFLLSSPGIVSFIDTEGLLAFAPQSIDASNISKTTTPINLDEWFHFAGTYDGSTTKIYINGEEVVSDQIDKVININVSGTTRIGGNGTTNFTGFLDDVSVYNYALNASEIAQLYGENDFALPVVSGVFPASGAPGSTIRIYGDNFNQAGTVVNVGGTQVTPTIVNDNLLYFTVPDIGSGSKTVFVSNNFDSSLSSGFTVLNTNESIISFGAENAIPSLTTTPWDLLTKDFNQDGFIDLIVSTSDDGIVQYMENDGTNSFPSVATIYDGIDGVPVTLVSGDFDKDGDFDIAVHTTDEILVFENNGSGSFDSGTSLEFGSGANFRQITSGDLNGDGYLDLVVVKNAEIKWYQNDGSGVFNDQGAISTTPAAFILNLNDLDNDGDLDIAQANNTNFVLFNDGFGSFSQLTLTTPTNGSDAIATGDFNGDGFIDIIAGTDNPNNEVFLYINNGVGGFNEPSEINNEAYASPTYLEVGDFDGDTDLDVVVAYRNSGSVVLLDNDGNAAFTQVELITDQSQVSRLSAIDMDEDGDLDIFLSTRDGNIAWFENQIASDRKEILSYGLSTGATPSDTEFTYLGEFEGSRYYQSVNQVDWNTAKTTAESLGGHLAAIHSQEENDFLTNLVGAVWIGGTDQDSEGQFKWADGTPLDYTNWGGDEPNGGTDENYIEFLDEGLWNDLIDGEKLFVVEIPVYEGVITSSTNSIAVEVPFGTDVSSMVAYFEISAGAFAELNAEVQQSGVSINDFSSDATYVVTAEDQSFKEWTVSVTEDDGLLAAYSFTGNASDDSGNGLGLTVDGPVLTEDRFGNANAAYSFDGDDDEMLRTDSDVVGGEYETSLVIWVNPDDVENFQYVLNFGNLRSYITAGNIHFGLSIDFSFNDYASEIEAGEWQQFVMTYDADTIRIYKDGALTTKAERYGAIDAGSFNMNVGRNFDGNFYDGMLDDVQVYNRALSESEIQTLYKEGGWPPLNTETDILSFSVSNEREQIIDPSSHTIDILVDFNSDVNALVPSFTLSDGAIALVNNTLQTSGTSIVDFTSPVTYSITAEDNITMQDWLVTIERDSVQGDSLALVALYNATEGDNWTTSWNLVDPMSTWGGLTFNSEGRVTSIILDNNNLTGELPSELGNLTKIRLMQIASNNLTGTIPASLGNLANLQSLHLYENQLTGSIPSGLGNLSPLFSDLILHSNQLSGSIPSSLGNLSGLWTLNVSNNNLTGSIPTQLGNIEGLITLDVSSNNLTGSIPTSLGNIGTSLKDLFLRDNNLSGTIPGEISGLVGLTQFTADSNQLSGTIPDVFGSMNDLSYVHLGDNNLSGSIPVSLGKESLQFLDLSSNNLSGDIPSEFSASTQLRFFRVEENRLTSLPDLTGAVLAEGLSVQNNKIGFTDIQANLSVSLFDYNPQTVDDTVTQLVSPAEPIVMSTSESASGTNYQWQKDDANIDGATASTLEVTEPGRYTVVMTNDNVPDLTITRAPYILTGSEATEILSFSFNGFESDVTIGDGTIDVIVPFGSPDISSLVAVFELSPGASAAIGAVDQQSGVTENDFSTAVTYTVTALDGTTTQNWIVTTTVGPNPTNDIENFDIANMVGDEAIDLDNHTVDITMPYNTDRSSLTPFIAISVGGTINPPSEDPQDFRSPFVYTVTSESGVAQDWTVTVTNELNNETDILSFVIPNQVVDESIDADNHTILVRMPFGTDVTALIPNIELSAGALVNPASGVSRDFTNPVIYNVIPEDNSASQSWTVTVEVDASPNNSPTALLLDNNSIDENTIGLVGSLSTTDADVTDSHIYSLINGIGATDNSRFTISENQLSSLEEFDFETQSSYSILVRTNDQRGGTFDQQFTITVNDVNEAPTIADQTFSIDENAGNDAYVDNVTANDVDGNSLTYSIINGVTAFAITTGGAITVNDESQLDFETTPTFNLTIEVSDGELTDEATITINLNDVNDAPVIEDQSFSIDENTANSSPVGNAVAIDADANSTLSFSITNGVTAFAITTDGAITVNDDSQLDFETSPTFNLTVSVTDGVLTSEATVTINLNDVNEAPVIEDQTFAIDENLANTSSVGTVIAVDQDDNIVSFSITAGNTGNAFVINNSGLISVNDESALDFETNPQFSLSVSVQDGGDPALQDEATITINLNDLVENATPTAISFVNGDNDIPENSAIGFELTFETSDEDVQDMHTYALISGGGDVDNGSFLINNDKLVSQEVFDYEGAKTTYSVRVETNDGNGGVFEQVLTVDIINVNESTNFSLTGNPTSSEKVDFDVTATITDDDAITSVKLYTKKITGSSFTASANIAAGSKNEYTQTINGASVMDNIGVEYFFEMEDEFGVQRSDTSIVSTVVGTDDVDVSNNVNPGTSVSNYSILAFPFEGVNVQNVFGGLGENQIDWRLLRYAAGENIDNNSGSLTPGVGYWFITKTANPEINTGGKSVTTDNGVFRINLNPSGGVDGNDGFTLIGNPFQGTLNWGDVIQHNIDQGIITSGEVQTSLIGYDGQFDNQSSLSAFEGAFIQSSRSVNNFEIPVSAVSNGGRIGEDKNEPQQIFIDDSEWELDLFFKTKSYQYSIGGIGIKPEAKDSRDNYDLSILPRLELYLDLYFEDKSTRSIKKTDGFKSWSFNVRNNLPEDVIDMTWDIPVSSSKTIILVDGASKKMYDLKETKSIQMKNNSSATHQLYYGDKKTIFENLDLDFDAYHASYPNPMEDVLTIEMYGSSQREVSISLVGLDGKTHSIGSMKLYEGLNKERINLEEYSIPAGVYFLKVDGKVATKVLKR